MRVHWGTCRFTLSWKRITILNYIQTQLLSVCNSSGWSLPGSAVVFLIIATFLLCDVYKNALYKIWHKVYRKSNYSCLINATSVLCEYLALFSSTFYRFSRRNKRSSRESVSLRYEHQEFGVYKNIRRKVEFCIRYGDAVCVCNLCAKYAKWTRDVFVKENFWICTTTFLNTEDVACGTRGIGRQWQLQLSWTQQGKEYLPSFLLWIRSLLS